MSWGTLRLAGAAVAMAIVFALFGATASALAACPECDEYKLVIPPVKSAGGGNDRPPPSGGEDTAVAPSAAPAAAPAPAPAPVTSPETVAEEPEQAAPASREKENRKRERPEPVLTSLAGAETSLPPSRPLAFDPAGAVGTGIALVVAALAAPLVVGALRRRRDQLKPAQ